MKEPLRRKADGDAQIKSRSFIANAPATGRNFCRHRGAPISKNAFIF
jgi:hypothetical protein